jgi:hypothetical protein
LRLDLIQIQQLDGRIDFYELIASSGLDAERAQRLEQHGFSVTEAM